LIVVVAAVAVPANAAPEHPHTTTIAASSRLAKRPVTVNHLVVREFS
jgi:hypothetical protein